MKPFARSLADNGIEIATQRLEDSLEDNVADVATKLPKAVLVSSPARNLDTVFQPSTDSPCLVFYTVELTVSFSLLSSQSVTVDILCDSSNPPTTSQGQAKLVGNQTLGLGVSLTNTVRQQLVAYVPAGDYVMLDSSGLGTPSLISQLELEFNG